MSWSKDHRHRHYRLHSLSWIWINYKNICCELRLQQKTVNINILRQFAVHRKKKRWNISNQNRSASADTYKNPDISSWQYTDITASAVPVLFSDGQKGKFYAVNSANWAIQVSCNHFYRVTDTTAVQCIAEDKTFLLFSKPCSHSCSKNK